MPDAPTPLDLDTIRAMLGDRLAVTTRSVALDLLAEVERLRAELDQAAPHITYDKGYLDGARAARPAPAWDEEAAVEAVSKALREHGGWFADLPADEMDCCARAVLAVVREHLPVKPDREAVARAIDPEAFSDWSNAHDPRAQVEQEARRGAALRSADKALDLWPGESRATVQAEALRDAADAEESLHSDYAAAERLRDRADRLAAEGGDDRG